MHGMSRTPRSSIDALISMLNSMAATFASRDRKVQIVFETADPFVATVSPLPDCIRKSRWLDLIDLFHL